MNAMNYSPNLNLSLGESISEEFKFYVDHSQEEEVTKLIDDILLLPTHCGEDLNAIVDQKGDSLLHHLSSVSLHPISVHTCASKLIKAGYRVNMQNNCGKTPLHNAVNIGYKPLIALLMEADPTLVRKADAEGRIPMHIAVSNKSSSMIEYLITQDNRINQNNQNAKHMTFVKDNQGKSSVDIFLGFVDNNRSNATGGRCSWVVDADTLGSLQINMSAKDLQKVSKKIRSTEDALYSEEDAKLMNKYIAKPALKRLRASGDTAPESASKRSRRDGK